MRKPAHIGIVGCSAEGAALCYRTMCTEAAEHLGENAHPEVSMHTHSLADYVACLVRNDLPGVAELMLDSARKLAAAGAEFLICPDNTIHQAMAWVSPVAPLPWLHIADAVASAAQARGFTRLGLTGTHWLLASELYPRKLADYGMACVRPEASDCTHMGHLIMQELVRGEFRASTVAYFEHVIARLKAQGCDAVILGCTEIPLIISDENSVLPTLDSTRLLARAALRRAIEVDR